MFLRSGCQPLSCPQSYLWTEAVSQSTLMHSSLEQHMRFMLHKAPCLFGNVRYIARCALTRVHGLLLATDCYFIEKVRATLICFPLPCAAVTELYDAEAPCCRHTTRRRLGPRQS